MSKVGYNVGSGQRPFTSTPEVTWINVDVVARDHMPMPDLVCDGAHLPCEDAVADYYVLHHCVEHLWPPHAEELITEAYRVLQPGGSLLVFVPDMRMLAEAWILRGQPKVNTQLYMTNVYGAYMGDEADRHKWGYDRNSLFTFLTQARNWSYADVFDWRTIPGASICRDWWIAGIECVK